MTIPTRPAPAPPQTTQRQSQNVGVNNSNFDKIKITLPPPPSSKTKICDSSTAGNSSIKLGTSTVISSNNEKNNKSITRHFPHAKTRYVPTTSWSGASFNMTTNNISCNKRMPPPRPPPPKIPTNLKENKLASGNRIIKSSRAPQSVNVLSNIFGRRKSPIMSNTCQKNVPQKFPQVLNSQISTNNLNSSLSLNNLQFAWSNNLNQQSFSSSSNASPNYFDVNDLQLINFDSPPNSPTFTQKSNSDCVSVDSFSSDSNFSSPHNGSVSQPESGFEDDFNTTNTSSNSQITTPVDPWDILNDSKDITSNNCNQLNYMHLNNMKNIDAHPIRNLHILHRKNNESIDIEKTIIPPLQKLGMPTIIRPKIQKELVSKSTIYTNNSEKITNIQNAEKVYDLNASYDDTDPPMPTCPPPPPPINLKGLDFQNTGASYVDDSINFNSCNSVESPYGIALYDFDGIEDGDLSLKENDKIYLLSRLNEEWYMGKNKKGCEGIFPSSYIDVKVPLNEDKSAIFQIQNTNNIENKTKIPNHYVRVLYTFNASHPDDLTIIENEMVKVLYRINDDWLYGEFNNKQGQFPANFIEKIPNDLVMKMP